MGVAQHHQLRRGTSMAGDGGFESCSGSATYTSRRPSSGCDHHIAAMGHREVVGVGVARDPHRRVGFCTGLGTLVDVGNCQICLSCVVALPGWRTAGTSSRRYLPPSEAASPASSGRTRSAGAAGQSDLHATVADHVEQGAFHPPPGSGSRTAR